MAEPDEPQNGLIGSLAASLENVNFEDENNLGTLLANMFGVLNRTVSEGGDLATVILGPDLAQQAARNLQIKEFFQEKLQTMGMREAIITTKQEFQLADDYTMKLEIVVSFAPLSVAKSEEPSID